MALFSFFVLIVISTWHFEPIPEASEYISLDVDTTGVASVAYYKNSVIYYAQRVPMGDSFQWLTEIVDSGAAGYYYGAVELAVDEELNPHIIYFKYGLTYTTKDSLGSWQSIILDSVVSYKSGLDTDTLNYPHVVYFGNSLWHQYWDGSTWIKEYIDYMIGYISLVIDKESKSHFGSGAPVILNEERGGWVEYGVRDSSGWYTEYMSEFDVRWPVGIAVDNNCDPHLSFNVFYGESYHIMKQDTVWIYDDITSLGFFGTVIAIDNLVPHLLGIDSTYSYVRHIWKPDSEWLFEDIYGSGYPKDLAIDKAGYLHCVIEDSLDIIYGTTRPQSVYEQTNSVLNSHQIVTISRLPLKISLSGLNSVKEIKVIDISGRLVKKLSPSKNTSELIWHGLDQYGKKIRSGVYFLMFGQKEKINIQKVLIII